ncbi:MAG: hypothetical protein K2X77_30525 [Candidatus Obscuribacterales bacterium]|nr:hypothetical protein [Candidatus Obscuribacterales bacterium]
MKISIPEQISCTLMAVAFSISLTACGGGESPKNELDVGFHSKVPESIQIEPSGLANYNGKTKASLFEMRTKAANAHANLVKAPYSPSADLFQIDDKASWWALKGFLFGQGMDKVDGPSRESAFFGNPYMLVAPEWYAEKLNPASNRFPTRNDFANVFPTYLLPASIKIFPKEAREEIVYNIMPHYNMLKSMMTGNWPISNLAFNLNAYNARDFGFNYIYIDASKSKNLQKYSSDVKPIGQAIGQTKSCAPACNDLTGTPDDLTAIKLKDVPAQCHILLWKEKPSSYVKPADMTVDIVINGG